MLPWAEMLRSWSALGFAPVTFWACSVREWRWLTNRPMPVLGRDAFDELARQFPDSLETRND